MSKEACRVSVIVPVYKVEQCLRRCVDSILAQTFTDFELILIDDGSPDNCGKICDEYAELDNRIKVIHQANGGVSIARNIGLSAVNTDYVCFVDSDDYVKTDYLELMINVMRAENCDMVIAGIAYCRSDNDVVQPQDNCGNYSMKISIDAAKAIAELLQARRLNYVYSKLYKKSVIDNYDIHFNKDIRLGEDTLFVIDYLTHSKKVSVIGEWLYYYIKYPFGTLSTSFYEDIYSKYILINNGIEKLFFGAGLLEISIQKAIDERYLLSAQWSVDMIRRCSDMPTKKKLVLVEDILHHEKFKSAMKRNGGIVKLSKELLLMRLGSARLLLHYYKLDELICRIRIKLSSTFIRKIWRSIRHGLFSHNTRI